MFKNFLYLLDKPPDDDITERLNKEPIYSKHLNLIFLFILFMTVTTIACALLLYRYMNLPSPDIYSINPNKEILKLKSVPYAHQSLKNIEGWISDAVSASLTLDFANFDEEVKNAKYYFTDLGYNSYLSALKSSGFEGVIKSKKVLVTVIPTQDPIAINPGQSLGDTFFWKFRVPIIMSYYAGDDRATIQHATLDILIVRVPSHLNHKGLSIAQLIINDR